MSISKQTPDRDTLRLWMSALLDGELGGAEEAQLFAALADDEALAIELEALSEAHDAFMLGDDERFAEPARLSELEAASLAASIFAATTPGAMPANPESAGRLASLALDHELAADGYEHLVALLADERALGNARGFVAAAEATGELARSVVHHAVTERALAALPTRVQRDLDVIERVGLLASALMDDELTAENDDELRLLARTQPLLAGYGFDDVKGAAFASEALRDAGFALARNPAAARAGEAALQAIAATALQEQHAAALVVQQVGARAAARERGGFFQGLWAGIRGSSVALASASAAAVALFALAQPPSTDAAKRVDDDEGTRAALVAALLEKLDMPVAEDGDLKILDDNSDTEVEAVEAGTETALVFSTNESHITIIWVPEPEEQGT